MIVIHVKSVNTRSQPGWLGNFLKNNFIVSKVQLSSNGQRSRLTPPQQLGPEVTLHCPAERAEAGSGHPRRPRVPSSLGWCG